MITTEQNKFFDILETKNAPIDKWFKSLPFHGRVTGSNPVGSTKKDLVNLKIIIIFELSNSQVSELVDAEK